MYQYTQTAYAPGGAYSVYGTPQVYVNQPVVVRMPMQMMFLPYPQSYNCPHCKASIVTRTETENGIGTWLICGILCIMGFWCGCQFIPFCVDSLKDVKHFCPNCNNFLGVRRVL